MMRINVTQGVKEYDGSYIKTGKFEDGRPVLDKENRQVQEIVQLRTFLINALNSSVSGETLVAEDKAQIYYLSVKLFRGKEVDLTENDMKFILDRVSKLPNFTPILYGRIAELFEGKTAEVEPASTEKK